MQRKDRDNLALLFLPAIGLLAAGLAAPFLPGCKIIESGADALADATAGSSVSNVFRGTARMAEGLRDYSPSEVHFIGRAVAAEILARYKVHDGPRLAEYVNLIGQSVVLSNPEVLQTFTGYHFTVLESDEVNAVSAPGGFVFLTLGTVRKARNEDELAAVIAHEIAHVSLGHGIAAIQKETRKKSMALLLQGLGETGAAVANEGGDAQGAQLVELTGLFASAVQDVASQLLIRGYDRKSELEADQLGAQYLKGTGYSQAALSSYLENLGAAGGQGGWFGTHPAPKDRVEALRDVAKDDPESVLAGVPIRQKRFQAALRA